MSQAETDATRAPIVHSPQRVLSLATEAFIELARTQHLLQGEINKLFRDEDATPQQYGVLRVLYLNESGALPCLELAERLTHPGPDVTRLLERLSKQRWVRRTRRPDDRRVVMVELTDRARRFVERMEPLLDQLHAERFAALEPEELAELRRLLRKVRE